MATATKQKPKPTKSVNRAVNGKIPSQESLLVNTLSTIQNDIRELRSDIKWILGLGLALVFGMMTYLHSDLKSNMKDLKTAVKQNSESINQIDQKLDKLLRK